MFELREAVPASVNSAVATTKAHVHPDIQKTAGDMIVPFDRLEESIAIYRARPRTARPELTRSGATSPMATCIPNVVPAALRDVEEGQAAILDDGARGRGDGRRAARRARRRAAAR